MDVETAAQRRNATRILLISDSAHLIEWMQRLAAVVGTTIDVVSPALVPRGAWTSAGLVLLDAEGAREVVPAQLPRRAGVILLASSSGAEVVNPWQLAVATGCGEVALLPESEPWVIEQLQAVQLGSPREGRLIAVIGSSGGAGASTLATGLASCQAHKRSLLVDTDHHGGGIDVLLGAERTPGIRWSDLLGAHGRLSPATLDYALPHANGVAVVSFGRGRQPPVGGGALGSVLDAAIRGYDLIVVDLARWWLSSRSSDDDEVSRVDEPGNDPADAVLSRADGCVVVVANGVRAVAAAASTVEAVRDRGGAAALAIRLRPRGLSAREVSAALAIGPVVEVPDERAVMAAGETGELPSARSRLMRACVRLHEHLAA